VKLVRDVGSHAFARNVARDRLLERLAATPWQFDFSRAVWLLERYLGAPIVTGGRGPVAREMLRFRPHILLGFPATDVRRLTRIGETPEGLPVFQMDVTFLGLYGVATPLPLHYAVQVLRSSDLQRGDIPGADDDVAPPAPEAHERAVAAEAAATRAVGEQWDRESGHSPVRDFVDLLHHRIISYYYRAGIKYRYDMSFGIPGRDDITRCLLMLIGISPDAGAETLGVDPIRLIRYAGLLTQRPRSAASLEGFLSDYWQDRLPFRVKEQVGRWVALPLDDMNRIGLANSRLGEDLTAGEQVFDLSGAFNIEIGPVDWATYLEILPDRATHVQTRAMVRLFVADPFSFTLEVKLKPGEVPPTQLTSDGQAGRLGLTSWVRTKDVPETSVIFSEMSCAASRFTADRGRAAPAARKQTSHSIGPGAADHKYMAAGANRPMG